MSDRRFTLRLGTVGGADVTRTFDLIAESGDASAIKLQRSYNRGVKAIEADLEALERKRNKVEVLAPGLTPGRLDSLAGVNDGVGKSAQGSASVFEAAYAKMERRATALVAAIDPLYAAQLRVNAVMTTARAAYDGGALSAERFAQIEAHATAELQAVAMAQGRAGTSAGAHRSALQGLSYQAQDTFIQLSMGANPLNVLAIQGGQAAGQMQNMGGKLGAVAGVLAGPWGLAISGGLFLLAPFVAKIFEHNDAVGDEIEKLRESAAKTAAAEVAKAAFARTEAGVIDNVRALTEELKKQNDALGTNAERLNIRAKQNLSQAQDQRAEVAALLKQALDTEQRNAGQKGGDQRVGLVRQSAIDRIRGLESRQAELDKTIALAEAGVQRSRIGLAEEEAKRATDRGARINKLYDDQVAAARRAANAQIDAGQQVTASLTRQLTAIEKNRQAALKAEQERQRAASASGGGQSGRNITLAEARSLAEGAGGRVTSDHRTYAEQAVLYARYKAGTGSLAAKPGTSNHELDQAIDVAKGSGVTLAKLVAAFRSAGVRLTEKLDEGNHYHLAWAKVGAVAREATEAKQEAAKQAREAEQAQKALVTSVEGMQEKYLPAAAAGRKYAEALAEIAKLEGLAAGNPAKIDGGTARAFREGALRDKLKVTSPELFEKQKGFEGFLETDKKREEDKKRTAEFVKSTLDDQGERLQLARRELELVGASDRVHDAELRKLSLVLDLKRQGVAVDSDDGKAILANDAALGEYLDTLRQQQQAWDELRQTGSRALDTLFDPSSGQSWGQRIKSVLGDLKAEFLKLALLNPLKNLLFGEQNATFGGASGGGGVGKFLGGLFGGGSRPSADLLGLLAQGNGNPTPPIAGNAGGTEHFSGGATWLAENGPEIVNLPRGSRVTPAAETRRLLAANDRGPSITFAPTINAPGADAAGLARVEAHLRQMSEELPARAVAAIQDASQRRMLG